MKTFKRGDSVYYDERQFIFLKFDSNDIAVLQGMGAHFIITAHVSLITLAPQPFTNRKIYYK